MTSECEEPEELLQIVFVFLPLFIKVQDTVH